MSKLLSLNRTLIRFGGFSLLILLVATAGCRKASGSVLDIAPPGGYVALSEQDAGAKQTFTADQKIVATYYFYWYDVGSNAHIINHDGTDALQDHPATMEGFSYKNVEWHKQEILDMLDAGIDIMLPVYWGDTGCMNWSVPGLERLVEACESLEDEGITPPKIGMFYDTSSLWIENKLPKGTEYPDLTKTVGKEYFYKLIRDFYSLIPPRFRARIDEKPIVWLYSSGFTSKHDQSTFDYVDNKFQEDFGGKDPYIVRERSWGSADSENIYAWGAALGGPSFLGVIALGPGYDDRAVPGRTTPVRDREEGKFYEDSWLQALVRAYVHDMNIVVIETWNEFHEGTDIANSREYGRQYIDMTRHFVERFKAGFMPEEFPGKEFLGVSKIWVDYQENPEGCGVWNVQSADGETSMTEKDGVACIAPLKTQHAGVYVYFKINEFFKIDKKDALYRLTVEYYDAPFVSFSVQYDSKDPAATLDGAYKDIGLVKGTGSNTWKTTEFTLKDARFVGRQNAGADFRIDLHQNLDLFVKAVSLEVVNE